MDRVDRVDRVDDQSWVVDPGSWITDRGLLLEDVSCCLVLSRVLVVSYPSLFLSPSLLPLYHSLFPPTQSTMERHELFQ